MALGVLEIMSKLKNAIINAVRLLFKQRVLVLGDSHAGVFRNKIFRKKIKRIGFQVLSVGGATVSGLKNPNSVTNAVEKYTAELRKYRGKIVVVMLGEVDTGFTIWFYAEKHGCNIDESYTRACENYKMFLLGVRAGFETVVISAPLPSIEDGDLLGEVANLRKSIKASQAERIKLTVRFNQEIEVFCLDNDIMYLNLDTDCLNPFGGIRKEYLNHDPKDHHYNQNAFAKLIVSRLVKVPYFRFDDDRN